jgi:hypothetical protein
MIRSNTWESTSFGHDAIKSVQNNKVDRIKRDIADIFGADNPRFNRQKFYRACEPKGK